MLVRLFTEPLGTSCSSTYRAGGLPPGWPPRSAPIGAELGRRCARALGGPVPVDGVVPASEPAFLAGRARGAAPTPRTSPWWSAPGSGPARSPAAWTACSPSSTRRSGSWSWTTPRRPTRPPRCVLAAGAAARSTTCSSPRPACRFARNAAVAAAPGRDPGLDRRRRGGRPALAGARWPGRCAEHPRGRRRLRRDRPGRAGDPRAAAGSSSSAGTARAAASPRPSSPRPPPTGRARSTRCRRSAPART